MEPIQKPTPPINRGDEDVDLGQLFYKTGGVINNFFSWLGRLFEGIGNLLLETLFFLRRNLIWLLIGTALGLGYGIFLLSKNGNNYFSEMTVGTNYNSARALYGSVNFFNALIGNGETKQLAAIFNITEKEAASLNSFQAAPVESEMIVADLYKDRFLNLYHNTRVRMDTFWIKTIKYEDFKASLTKFDYPIHLVRVISNNAFIFPKIQQGVVTHISSNKMLQDEKAIGDATKKMEEQVLLSSIESLDTLRNTYNRRLSAVRGPNESGNNVTLLEGNLALKNPELDLYDKILQLKDELKMVKSQSVIGNDILQIYAPFNAVGQKERFLDQKVVKYAFFGLLAALIITSFLSLYRWLIRLEASHAKRKTALANDTVI